MALRASEWDGRIWSALGSGMNDNVRALAVSGGTLYAGGNFTTAGTNASAYAAEAIVGIAQSFVICTNSNFEFTNGYSQFGFDVNAIGDAGQTLVIQGSTNLVDWVPLQSNVLNSSLFHFSDPYASNFIQRFYRAQVLP